ncbi:hypothetical protein AAG906_020265 [Vitis piasezkii]
MDGEDQKPSLESPLISQEAVSVSRNGAKREEILGEVKKQLKLAGPLVSVNLLLYSLQVISLSGACMATSFASVTGFSLMTFGAKQYHMLGVHKQRAMVVLLLVSIPVAFIWNNTGHILASLGQDPEISAEAGLYAHFMIPSIFTIALLQCHIRFLQAQNNVVPQDSQLYSTPSLVGWAALANAISYWINVLLLAIYVRISPSCKKTWTGFSKEALHVLKFLKLAIPSAIMLCLEIWSFEMMVLLSGLLPNPKLETSVLSISLNTYTVLYMIPLGLSGATSTRVSNELGAGRPQAALLAVYVALFMVAIEGILVATALILGRNFWGYAYSSEEKVVNYVGEMMFLLAGSHLIDGIQSVLSGVVRGSGKQKIGALVNLGAYYLAGIPSGALLAFVYHIGGKGLWTGIIVSLFMQALFLAKKATDRVYDSMVPVNAISSS